MKASSRYLVTAATALAVFAVSFGVAKAVANPADETPVDAAIQAPETSTATATVLSPEVTAGTGAVPLSALMGTAAVTLPSTESPDASLSPQPSAGAELEAPEPPAQVIAAAAALDSSAGSAEDLVTPPSDEPTPQPSPSAEASPASDPCATGAATTCPEGLAATLYDLELDPSLLVTATADPVTGPNMGAVAWCPAAAVPDGALRMGAFSTDDATVTVRYWPTGHPSENRELTPRRVQLYSDGSARYCGTTEALAEGTYDATVEAVTADGRYSEARMFHFDSRGRPTVPGLQVVPLGSNWVWVGALHTQYQTAFVFGTPATEGGTCTAPSEYLVTPIASHTSEVSSAYLSLHNFEPVYQRSTSALVYVPEGTSALVCALTSNESDPSWASEVPERIQSATVSAPDSWEAIVTLRSVTAYRPGSVQIEARGQLGNQCGFPSYVENTAAATDTAHTIDVGEQLCAIAGQNIQLSVRTSWQDDAGRHQTAERVGRYLIPGAGCTGTCPEPAPVSYSVFLPGLGQDQCPDSVSDDCELRRRTLGAAATVDVTWRANGDGTVRDWTVGGRTDVTPTDVAPERPRFDTNSYFTTAYRDATYRAVTASGTLTFDRKVDFTVEAVGTCFANGATGSTARGTSPLPSSGKSAATVSLPNLCPGERYGVVVRFRDESGHDGMVAGTRTPGVESDSPWARGDIVTPHKEVRVKAQISITTLDELDASWTVRDSWLYLDGNGFSPSFGGYMVDRCFGPTPHERGSDSAVIAMPLQNSYALSMDLNIYSDFAFSRGVRSSSCDFYGSNLWKEDAVQTLTLAQLEHGITVQGYLDCVWWNPNPQLFKYTITFAATVEDADPYR
jgi:hypothetical protein